MLGVLLLVVLVLLSLLGKAVVVVEPVIPPLVWWDGGGKNGAVLVLGGIPFDAVVGLLVLAFVPALTFPVIPDGCCCFCALLVRRGGLVGEAATFDDEAVVFVGSSLSN